MKASWGPQSERHHCNNCISACILEQGTQLGIFFAVWPRDFRFLVVATAELHSSSPLHPTIVVHTLTVSTALCNLLVQAGLADILTAQQPSE